MQAAATAAVLQPADWAACLVVPACPVGVASCVMQGAHRLLLNTTNIKMGVRLGLLKQDHSRALVFEVDSGKMKGERAAAAAAAEGCSAPVCLFLH